MFGNKRNSTGGEDQGADLLDDILDDMEEKKGIETSKKSGAPSVGSQSASHSQQPQQRVIKPPQGQTDAWGRETFNEFEDLDNGEDTKRGGGAQTQNLLEKKRALFGLGGG